MIYISGNDRCWRHRPWGISKMYIQASFTDLVYMNISRIQFKPPIVWKIHSRGLLLLTFVTLFYLVWQMSLSGAILTATTEEQSQRLSDLARWTVGFGTALLTVRIGYTKGGRPLLVGILALALGYGATRLEDTIVNTMADRTNGEERQDAKAVLLFNRGLAEGKARMTELAPQIAHSQVRLKAFSKVLGFAIWQDPTLMNELRHINEKIFPALFLPHIYAEVDKKYAEYVEVYNKYAPQFQEIKDTLTSTNYAQLFHVLRQQLVQYAQCSGATCQQLQSQVDRWLQKNNMHMTVSLGDFCRNVPSAGVYVMGRSVGTSSQRICSVTEAELYAHAQQSLRAELLAQIKEKNTGNISSAKLEELLDGPGLTLEQWRQRSDPHVQKKLEELREENFRPATAYAKGGPHAEEGRDHSIAVFLPPVALGFSVVVCVLHLTSMTIVLLGHSRLCTILGTLALFLPALCAASVPVSGFAGIYARWLIFWEAAFYPCGLLRPLIL